MININVNVKGVSGRKSKITTLEIPYDEGIESVRDLIKATVEYCVNSYNERRENSELLSVLSSEEIEDKAVSGKISFGVNYGENNADLQKAIENALEAFSDGIVVIFADEKKLEKLDEKISPGSIGSFTFIKLTMLAGRMW